MPSLLDRFKSLARFRPMSDEEFQRAQKQILSQTPVPVFWLFGKTGSGKTSVVKYLTGAPQAEIGSGFRPQTRFSRQYEFPSPENPVLRFLDTRGLGEGRYDPQEDIRQFDQSTHVMIVTARVMDHALASVVEPLRVIRAARPDRPVVLALTCLHDAYPQQQHPHPDPFDGSLDASQIPANLRRSIDEQRRRFEGLVDRIVPIDFTRPEEGFDEPNFGGERLKTALVETLPAAYRQTLLSLETALQPLKGLKERRAMPYIIGYSTMAATAAAVPLPWIDIPVVMAIQSHLVYQLASIYGQRFNADVVGNMAGGIGGRVLSRFLIRGPLKLIPYLGIAANATLAFAYTYAQGKVCCWYFGEIREGNAPSKDEIERVWSEELAAAAALWKQSQAANAAPTAVQEAAP